MRVKCFWPVLCLAALLVSWPAPALSHDPQPSLVEKGSPRRPVRLTIRDFSLADHEGKSFAFSALKGKLVLVSFIYTSCPDVCPLITSSMRGVQQSLNGGEKKAVHFLSITTDPEIDSPEILKSYARRYDVDFSNWSLLTGDIEALKPVWTAFGVKVERKARGLINHTSLTVLVDRNGVVRFAYYGTAPDAKKVLHDMRSLLAR